MFFWGYIILQIPAGRLAGVWSAKWVIMLQLMLWCGMSLSTAFVHDGDGIDRQPVRCSASPKAAC